MSSTLPTRSLLQLCATLKVAPQTRTQTQTHSQFGLFTEASHFTIGDNSLTGALPTELGHITKTTDFVAHSNFILSTVPTELGKVNYVEDYVE